jgi:hypothetical protein
MEGASTLTIGTSVPSVELHDDGLPLTVGVYRAVKVGFTITDELRPLWSVDIAVHLLDGPSFVGNGATLAEASEAAAQAILDYRSAEEA